MMSDLIDRQALLEKKIRIPIARIVTEDKTIYRDVVFVEDIESFPSAEPERLTDDDFETIRIHLNAYKEKLYNQQRWEEAEEYQRIIDRFMAVASAQPERKKGTWTKDASCPFCGFKPWYERDIHTLSFCPNCGADLRGEQE